jgi:hypothetical protein
VIPREPTPAPQKHCWTAEEDDFIRRQYAAGVKVAEIGASLASNYWSILKRVRELGLPRRPKPRY